MLPQYRGQSGIELAVFFSFLMLVLMILTIEASDRAGMIRRSRDALEAEKVGDFAASHINIAASVGDGYSSKFYLPETLTNTNYSITITTQEQRLEIFYGDGFSRAFPLLTSNVTGAFAYGENRLRNEKGEIIIG